MIIKNNKPKAAWFHYKIGGKIFKYQIPGNTAVDILDLTDRSQIVNSTYDRRIRHIENSFGYNYETTFEIPGDPDFVTFSIISSVSGAGNISPLGLTKVAKGENITYTMTAHVDENFSVSAHTTNSTYGSISPSGNSVASGYIYSKLNSFLIDGQNAISAITGTLTATTTYEFPNVDTTHTIAANFFLSSSTPSQIFTMSATSKPGYILTSHTTNGLYGSISPSGITSASNYYYLSSLIVDSVEKIGNVTGSTSATSTYNQIITTNHSINPIFTYFQETKTFEMTPEVSTIVLTAQTRGSSGGTISPDGDSINTGAYNYLSSFLIDSSEQISGVTGDISAMTTYNLTVTSNHNINPIFSLMSGSTTFTMTPNTNFYLKGLFVNSVDKIANVTGNVSGVTTYNLQNISTSTLIEALYKPFGG